MHKLTRRLVLGTSLAFGLSVGAFASANADDYKWPPYFSVITPIVGSGNHSLAVAWTTEFTAQTGIRVAIKPAPNGYARPEWLNSGEGDISLMQASEYFDQMDAVEGFMTRYFNGFDGRLPPPGLYHRVLREVEYPLIAATLAATRGNQIKAAEVLGVNRNTLRKKIRDLEIQVIRGIG